MADPRSALGGVVYINLDRRTDRRAEMEAELDRLDLSGVAERFAAIPRSVGILGCGLSHLAVLRLARERGLKNVLIFEDDFELLVEPEEFWTTIRESIAELEAWDSWDVIMLAYHIWDSEPAGERLVRVRSAQTASAYIVNACFYDRLIGLYEWAMPLLESTNEHWTYANDQVWKLLQPASRWFATAQRLGRQRASFSDTAEKHTDYGI